MAENNKNYPWTFCSLGGVPRVNIKSGEDIAHLGELDQKLWTVLSCPTTGLEFDSDTLNFIDTDHDGKIRVQEVVAAAEWLTSIVKDKDLILKGDSELPLDQFNPDSEAGARLKKSAQQILSNLGLEKDSISVAEASDSIAIFAKTLFNGDGIVTPAVSEDEDIKAALTACIEKIGSVQDRCGEPGVNEELLEKFYAACADYSAWQADSKADAAIFPFGADTAAALAATDAVKDKVEDFFVRCKLVKFDDATAPALDVSVDKVGAIGGSNLTACTEEIASYPLARPTPDAVLPLDAINPAWQGPFDAFKALVGLKGKTLDEAGWKAILDKFTAYRAWLAAAKGTEVESLGLEAVDAILKADKKAAILELIAKDSALKAESESIDEVSKLLHLYRDFYKFLKNYVVFLDFYSPEKGTEAIFQAGQLYVDQRRCDLCVKVSDMGGHAQMAGLSGMFLLYCHCVSKTKAAEMDIVAVMTDGDIKNLRPGKNAIFYDRAGGDWDATITKVVENPISIKAAFWSPYRRLANTITDRINKNAAEKESKVNAGMTNTANTASLPADGAKPAVPQPSFDIAKFAGIFAAIGMGLGLLGTALARIISPWYMPLIILGVLIICISGPSMFIAWQKLRRRNLGPILNANGWAINSAVIVNTLFGATLTSVAKYPAVKGDDPYKRHTPLWKKILRWLIFLLAVAFAAGYFTDHLGFMGIHRKAKEAPATEQVTEAPQAPEAAEAPEAE